MVRSMKNTTLTLTIVALFTLAGCAADSEVALGGETLVSADEFAEAFGELSTSVPVGTTLKTTGNLNLRSGAGTGYAVRLVIPKGATVTTVNQTAPSNGFYNVKYNGTTGWASGTYLETVGAVSGSLPVGSTLKTTAGLNLRSGAGTGYSVKLVIPNGGTVTTVAAAPSNGFYNVSYNGTTGWASGTYLILVSSPNNPPPPPVNTVRDQAIARAKTGVGFSYWWGHGRWLASGATSSNKGSCTGSCPSCSHGGSYGADCSGYVAKVWQVPSTNTDVSKDSHPYGTIHFVGSNANWSTISRDAAKKGDAFVYNTNGAGHIVIYESGDAWGSIWAYEARGCSYGIVHNLRSLTSAYKGIRRAGWN